MRYVRAFVCVVCCVQVCRYVHLCAHSRKSKEVFLLVSSCCQTGTLTGPEADQQAPEILPFPCLQPPDPRLYVHMAVPSFLHGRWESETQSLSSTFTHKRSPVPDLWLLLFKKIFIFIVEVLHLCVCMCTVCAPGTIGD